MAISQPLYKLLTSIRPLLPPGGSLLEIGEANWYGDSDPSLLFKCKQPADEFSVCKDLLRVVFAPSSMLAIDFNGKADSLKFDLNQPIALDRTFDVIINHGTLEHICNIGQVFKTIHERCEIGGVMIHDSPFNGWINHGFYCLQPTLFYDLAHANCYEVAYVAIYEIKSGTIYRVCSRDDINTCDAPNNACLFVAFKKRFDTEFKFPIQGIYDNRLSEAGKQAWESAR